MTTAPSRRDDRRISPVFLGITAVTAAAGWALWADFAADARVVVFLFVTSAWVVSLCLHEYAHARTALHSGDISVAAKGYLTLNPLAYTHALLSVVLPVLFVVLGGIGLPGGAVFVERHRIRGRLRHSLISAAGPLTNVLFALVCTAPFWLDALDGVPETFRFALAFLALLQVTAAILNFLPVPGLDGYGVLEPWLSRDLAGTRGVLRAVRDARGLRGPVHPLGEQRVLRGHRHDPVHPGRRRRPDVLRPEPVPLLDGAGRTVRVARQLVRVFALRT